MRFDDVGVFTCVHLKSVRSVKIDESVKKTRQRLCLDSSRSSEVISSSSPSFVPRSKDLVECEEERSLLFCSVLSVCVTVRLTLSPSGSSFSSPVEFGRNEDFTVTSSIEVNCNNSFVTQFQWSILNCSFSACLNPFPVDPTLLISTTGHELYIPRRTLPLGLYQCQLIVTMVNSSSLRSNHSVFVRILSSGMTVNLLPLGTSLISSGSSVDIELNPGLYSVDLDEDQFNAWEWNYHYFCRIFGVSNFPSLNGSLLSIGDSRVDPANPSCLNNPSGRKVIFFSFTCSFLDL